MTTTAASSPQIVANTVPHGSLALHPIAITAVEFDQTGFWGHRQHVNRTASLEHCAGWLDKAGWLPNFTLAVQGGLPEGRRGREFSDSEIYKVLEAFSWEYARGGGDHLNAWIARVTAIIGAAQEDDGYISTNFGRPGQGARYSDMEWGHELYCFGHLLQAVVARGRTAGLDDPLVAIGRRVADHVCREFGADGRQTVCGHPEIELGLVEFGRLVDEPAYVEQAQLFIDRRGKGILKEIEFGAEYFQDDLTVREATALRGHAVRALYLSAAAVDVAVDLGDAELLESLKVQWANTVARRTYLTGGMGSRYQDEAFGADWELPPDGGYCETCAGVAAVMFSWRMLLATGEAKYADFIERVLYNVVATSPAADGQAFFYANPLHQRVEAVPPAEDAIRSRVSSGLRAPWFEVSCCPPNVARTLATVGGYVATVTADAVQLHQYAPGVVRADVAEHPVDLVVSTQYPKDGAIRIEVREAPVAPWSLALRIPAWANGATVTARAETATATAGEYYPVGGLIAGDVVELNIPVAPRFTYPNLYVDAVRGTVAVERGPEVFCLESVDLPQGVGIDQVLVDDTTAPVMDESGAVSVRATLAEKDHTAWPYGTRDGALKTSGETQQITVPLLPYHEWANRGPAAMRVWMVLHQE